MGNKVREQCSVAFWQLRAFVKWVVLALVVGTVLGLVGTAFHFGLDWAASMHRAHPWLLFLLPPAGLIIVFLYHITDMGRDKGTNFILVAVRTKWQLRLRTAPLIFFSTILTHLCGGSAGREGAALQLGGCISAAMGRFIRLDEHDEHIITMCGMAAGFSALFGTPIAAAVFAMEVISLGVMYYAAVIPCVLAALTASLISTSFGVQATAFPLTGPLPELSFQSLLQVGGMGLLFALLSSLFCLIMHAVSQGYQKFLPNQYLRVVVGGLLVILITLLLGVRDYNGAGMDIIARALSGQAVPWAFLAKLLLTALTLGAGFKGGEIVPVFFVGATFGCTAAPLLGLSPAFGAALGMVSVFCGVTNSPIAAVILSYELFGGAALPLFALSCAISYTMSGYYSLYTGQEIRYSKFRPVEYTDGKLPQFRPGRYGVFHSGPEDKTE